MTTHHDDGPEVTELERRIGRWLDGRVTPDEARALEETVRPDPDAARTLESMRAIRTALRGEVGPALPAGLRDRVLERVGRARDRAGRDRAVLRLVRRLAVAAALLLCALLFAIGTGNARVGAGSDPHRTIGDELRARSDDGRAGSLVDFLAWYYLGRDR